MYIILLLVRKKNPSLTKKKKHNSISIRKKIENTAQNIKTIMLKF